MPYLQGSVEGAWPKHRAWEWEASVFLCTCKESLGSNKQPKFHASLGKNTGISKALLKYLSFSLLLGNVMSAFLMKLCLILAGARAGWSLKPLGLTMMSGTGAANMWQLHQESCSSEGMLAQGFLEIHFHH